MMLRTSSKRKSSVLSLAVLAATLFLLPASAQGAVGDRLDIFTPSPTGDGRGIEVAGNSSSAYYSTVTTFDYIYRVNLKSHASESTLDTNLEGYEPSRSYGALSWDAANGRLLGARYKAGASFIDAIDVNTGAVTPLFNANAADATITGVDGLAVDSDGTLWISADGIIGAPITVFHFSAAGAVLGSFVVGFDNSGIVVDGDSLWLVDVSGAAINQYTKAGAATGVSFPTTGLAAPEDVTIDNCSFAGKKAIWSYTADFAGGQMAAYEIGASSNAGCPAGAAPPNINDPGSPSKIVVKKPKGGYRAGRPISFTAPSTLDPDGIIFIYYWIWGDYTNFGPDQLSRGKAKIREDEQGKATIKHTFECAGFYKPKVRVLDAYGNQKTISLNRTLSVKFPASVAKKHGGLKVSPLISLKKAKKKKKKKAKQAKAKKKSGKLVSFSVSAKKFKKRPRTKIKSLIYFLDGKRIGRRKKAKSAVKRKVKNGAHVLKVKARFRGPKGSKTIKACFVKKA